MIPFPPPTMTPPYDFGERTTMFSRKIRRFIKQIPSTPFDIDDKKQIIDSSGSIGANYTESTEAMSKRDSIKCLKIARKEAKETIYWLKVIDANEDLTLEKEQESLAQEAQEIFLILCSMLGKLEK